MREHFMLWMAFVGGGALILAGCLDAAGLTWQPNSTN